jgi:signal transduction histidine kinase
MTPVKNFMMVQIRDSGKGIPAEDLPQIFDLFYQSTEGGDEKFGYSGLGLAITKRILELHDCPIEVSSAINSGTCFTFQLPLATRP